MSNLEVDKVKFFCHVFEKEEVIKFEKIACDILSDKNFFERPAFEELTRDEERQVTNLRLKKFLKELKKHISFSELFGDITKFGLVCQQTFSLNENLSTKMVVSLQLYYKTIDNLGTEIHNDWKQRAEDGEDIGCFGLTELGHGSNVKGILTTATFDKTTQEFILNTPCQEAMKFWIGGASKTSNTAAIFAQLYIDGKCYGPHAFVVQIRDRETHRPLNGVELGDCGAKLGIDGVDNGFIIFNNIRIPKRNLLNRFSDVKEDGTFVTDIQSHDQRFGL